MKKIAIEIIAKYKIIKIASLLCLSMSNITVILFLFLGQRIKLKAIGLFSQQINQDYVDVRLTLWKKQSKLTNVQVFQPLQSIQFSINCNQHFLQSKQIMIPYPQCCSMKVNLLNCPLIFYDQIQKHSLQTIKNIKIKKDQSKQQFLLQEIRKLIKKQRYSTFIVKKQLYNIIKNVSSQNIQIIKLPLHFIQKSNMSMEQVQTNQFKFFKYMAFYQKYYTSPQMLKQQIDHINFDKITLLKTFIQAFQKNNLLLTVLQQKQKLFQTKKYKSYLIQNQFFYNYTTFLSKYSNDEVKSKKQKIKSIDSTFNPYYQDHVLQFAFFNQKIHKTQPKLKSFIRYPIVFKDTYLLNHQINFKSDTAIINILTQKAKKKKKYFIFAHGFQGLPVDLTFLINMIRFSNQRVKILVLKSYKNNMGQGIDLMAIKAAQQIQIFFNKIDMNQIQPQITFIGHSMGPIILRAAFKHLSKYTEYFDSFISICAPHLGYIQGTKFLTGAGLSIISKFKPIQSLSQLSNRDNSDLQKTFIYKLSKQGSLKRFRRIILIASMQDDYVPWHSARIQPFLQKGNKQKIERQMICNIFGMNSKDSQIQKVQRIQISFPTEKQKSLNAFIGRAAHIKPLSDRGFLQILTKQVLFN